MQHSEIMTLEEIERISAVLTEMGITRIRLTGGEPLVRKGIEKLMDSLGKLPANPELVMTTNGVLLGDHLEMLKKAGLKGVNISLDTRNTGVYRELTGMDALEKVEQAVDLACDMGLSVKMNCVPIRGINDEEIPALAEYAKDREISVRFIELMPIGCAADYKGIRKEELLEKLEKAYGPASPVERDQAVLCCGPAEYVRFRDFKGTVGFISPISHAFCDGCNRIRLTASGQLKLCLYYSDGLDVKEMLRSGVSDEELKRTIETVVLKKPKRHSFTEPGEDAEKRNMYQIGG